MGKSDGNKGDSSTNPWDVISRGLRERQRIQQEQAADPRFTRNPPTYEQAVAEWALRDQWMLSEAANLLCACEPLRPTGLPGHERLDREVEQMQQALARSKIEREGKGLNALAQAEAVISWARAKGLELPPALARQFPSGDEGSSSSNSQPPEPHGNALRFSTEREAILQAAVTVIARYRHQCLDKGTVSAAAVARQIEVHQGTLFADGEAPQSTDAMRKLIARALNLWDANQ